MMTINGAWAMGVEDVTGSLERGKSADFIVLDQNLFEIDPRRIRETNVLVTIFRGERVHVDVSVTATF